MNIGILALQGAVEPHRTKLTALGARATAVRRPADLAELDGLIFPGGESSTMVRLLERQELWDPLEEWLDRVPSLGVCAGAILLSKTVNNPSQRSFGKIEVEATRNAYGTQLDSFIAQASPLGDWTQCSLIETVFIRAPRLRSLGPEARVLLRHGADEVLIAQGQCFVASFHPELSSGTEVHRYFLDQCRDRATTG